METYEYICSIDPAIDWLQSNADEYRTTRSPRGLAFRPGRRPTRFVCRDLPSEVMGDIDSARSENERRENAFRFACVRVEDVALPDGTVIAALRGGRRLALAAGAEPIDVWEPHELGRIPRFYRLEVGAWALVRAELPFDLWPHWPLPRTSAQAQDALRSLLADEARASAARSSAQLSSPAEQGPTPTKNDTEPGETGTAATATE